MVPVDVVCLDIVTDAIKIRTDLNGGRAVETFDHLHIRTTISEDGRPVYSNADIIPRNNGIGPCATIPFQDPVIIRGGYTAENIPFFRVINAIAICPDDHIITVAADFDERFHHAPIIYLEIVQTIREDIEEIA